MVTAQHEGNGKSDHDLLVEIKTMLDMMIKQDADHESRIRNIERKIYTWSGMAAAGGGILGTVLSHIHIG